MTSKTYLSAVSGLALFSDDQILALRDTIRSAYDQGYNDCKSAGGPSGYRGRDKSDEFYDDLFAKLQRFDQSRAKHIANRLRVDSKGDKKPIVRRLKWELKGTTFYADSYLGTWKVWADSGKFYYEAPAVASHGTWYHTVGLDQAFLCAQKVLDGIAYQENVPILHDMPEDVAQEQTNNMEIDDGCAIFRMGSTSLTICAETVTINDTESNKPAIKVPLNYDSVSEGLSNVQSPAKVTQAQKQDPTSTLIIKALEWEACFERSGYGPFVAKAQAYLGVLKIMKGSQGKFEVYYGGTPISGAYNSEDDAKDYAQEYFDRMVRACLTDSSSLAEQLGFVRKSGLRSLAENCHTSLVPAIDDENGYVIPVYIDPKRHSVEPEAHPVDALISGRVVTKELRAALKAIAGIKASLYAKGDPNEEGLSEMYEIEIMNCLKGVDLEDIEIQEAIEAGVPLDALERQAETAKQMLLRQADWVALALTA